MEQQGSGTILQYPASFFELREGRKKMGVGDESRLGKSRMY